MPVGESGALMVQVFVDGKSTCTTGDESRHKGIMHPHQHVTSEKLVSIPYQCAWCNIQQTKLNCRDLKALHGVLGALGVPIPSLTATFSLEACPK
jgi:hypothetical protein